MPLLVGMTLTLSWGTVEAQPSARFPGHTTVQVGGERHEAFDLGGFTELLRIDADLVLYSLEAANLREQVAQCTSGMEALQRAVDASTAISGLLEAERVRLLEMWERENRLRLEAENSPSILAALGWGLAAAFAVATLVLAAVGASR